MLRESVENLLDLQPGDRSDIVNRNHQGALHEGSVAGTEKGTSGKLGPGRRGDLPRGGKPARSFREGRRPDA